MKAGERSKNQPRGINVSDKAKLKSMLCGFKGDDSVRPLAPSDIKSHQARTKFPKEYLGGLVKFRLRLVLIALSTKVTTKESGNTNHKLIA